MPLPPEIKIPSTIGLAVLPAAPTEILVIVLPEIEAKVPAEAAIPLTTGEVVMTPVKFIALIVVPEIEWAPEPANTIPVIAVGDVADEVRESVVFEMSAVV